MEYAEFNDDVNFFRFRLEISFLGKFGQKNQIVSLRRNLIPGLIRICRINWCCSLFLFRPEILCLGKFGPKNEDCQVKLKLGTQSNKNM